MVSGPVQRSPRPLHDCNRSGADWHQPWRVVLRQEYVENARLPSRSCICTEKKNESWKSCHGFNRSYQRKKSPTITGDELERVEDSVDFSIIGEVGEIQTSESWFHQSIVGNFEIVLIDTMSKRHRSLVIEWLTVTYRGFSVMNFVKIRAFFSSISRRS